MTDQKFDYSDLQAALASVCEVKDGAILRLKKELWREKFEHASFRLDYYIEKLKAAKEKK